MRESFTCGVCGETHEGLTTNYAYKLPDDVWSLPPEDRDYRARFDTDLCVSETRFFMRCMLEVPFVDRDDYFGWGCWAEVERTVFDRYLALYEADGSEEPRHSGTIANDLPAYPNMLGAPVSIQFRQSDKRPSLHLLPDDQSQLASEQRSGIDSRRHHEILAVLESSPSRNKNI